MNLNVSSLILETTRRCNMNCAHCLRGDAQSMNMTPEIVSNLLHQVDSIYNVTFSGGEPTLNLPIIEFFFEEAERQGKLPSSFYVATNGSNQWELAKLLLKWYPKMDNKDFCGVSLSIDRFHEKVDGPNYLEGLAFYSDIKTHSEDASDNWVIHAGRAMENGIGQQIRPPMDFDYEVNNEHDVIFIDTLYVSANGLCTSDCDLSYDTVDEEGIAMNHLVQTLVPQANHAA